MDLIKYKEAIVNLIRKETPVGHARTMVLSLLESGKISAIEADKVLQGLDKVNIKNLSFTVDNSVQVNATHWGDIATGGAVIEEGYFATQDKREKERNQEHHVIIKNLKIG